jgi:hypothetical protein
MKLKATNYRVVKVSKNLGRSLIGQGNGAAAIEEEEKQLLLTGLNVADVGAAD